MTIGNTLAYIARLTTCVLIAPMVLTAEVLTAEVLTAEVLIAGKNAAEVTFAETSRGIVKRSKPSASSIQRRANELMSEAVSPASKSEFGESPTGIHTAERKLRIRPVAQAKNYIDSSIV